MLTQPFLSPRTQLEENQSLHAQGPEHTACLLDIPSGTVMTQPQLNALLAAPPIVMHSGAYFGIRSTAFENAYTQRSLGEHARTPDAHGVEPFPEADLECRALAAVYRLHGHFVTIMPPQPNSADGVFSTDSDKTFQKVTKQKDGTWRFGRVVTLHPVFTHEKRQVEAPWKERLTRTTLENPDKNARRLILHMHHPMEFGDTRVVFHKTAGKPTGFVLAGIAESNEVAVGRSTEEGHRQFEDYLQEHVDLGIEVVTIHLRQPFYHMDTSGPTGTGGHMFTNRAAYAPQSWELLRHIFGDKLVELPLADIGSAFGGNATCFGNRIYISDAISDTASKMIAERGYDVILTPIRTTMKGGGGHRCMTSVNPHIYVPGGYDLGFDGSRSGTISRVTVDYRTGRITLEGEDITPQAQEFEELWRERMTYLG